MGRTSLFDDLENPDFVEVLFLGESLTERVDFYTLFVGRIIVQRGIGGDTSKGILNRLNKIIKITPYVIILEVGIIDLMLGGLLIY